MWRDDGDASEVDDAVAMADGKRARKAGGKRGGTRVTTTAARGTDVDVMDAMQVDDMDGAVNGFEGDASSHGTFDQDVWMPAAEQVSIKGFRSIAVLVCAKVGKGGLLHCDDCGVVVMCPVVLHCDDCGVRYVVAL